VSPSAIRFRWLADLAVPACATAIAIACVPTAAWPATIAGAATAAIACIGSAIMLRANGDTEHFLKAVGLALFVRLIAAMAGVFIFSRFFAEHGQVAAIVMGGGLAATVLAEAVMLLFADNEAEHA
jgi:hypothetical protein